MGRPAQEWADLCLENRKDTSPPPPWGEERTETFQSQVHRRKHKGGEHHPDWDKGHSGLSTKKNLALIIFDLIKISQRHKRRKKSSNFLFSLFWEWKLKLFTARPDIVACILCFYALLCKLLVCFLVGFTNCELRAVFLMWHVCDVMAWQRKSLNLEDDELLSDTYRRGCSWNVCQYYIPSWLKRRW